MLKYPPPSSYLAIPFLSENEGNKNKQLHRKLPLKKLIIFTGLLILLWSSTKFMEIHSNPMVPEKSKEIVIVTGASGNHFCPLQGFLYSLHNSIRFLPTSIQVKVIVYDLGLGEKQRQELSIIQKDGYFHELQTFNYTEFPEFWNINKNRGEYAWKAGIIKKIADSHSGISLWMDSGNRVFPNFILDVIDLIEVQGFYSPTSPGDVRRWTHPKLFEYFDDDLEKYANQPNCNGAFIGFDSRNEKVMNSLINPLFECGLNQSCIAPEGSNRLNHRQDQAALTYLALSNKYQCSYEGLTGLLIHQDNDCKLQIQGHLRKAMFHI
ncbi:hypothetical protein K7432_003074 [Basidiobolus ranarum]|uniref:Uncharacterized protein n=1 Tax=Basidiobolus ranarum TaxID=34480 RepID=A0ABR2W6R8_9FUNG